MRVETNRLILRPWTADDAPAMYELCKNPKIGPRCGWDVHPSLEHTQQILRDFFLSGTSPEISYAMTLKDDTLVGSIGIKTVEEAVLDFPIPRFELGYWLGEEFWGVGYMPEAVAEALRICFEEHHATEVYVAHYDFNDQSCRVIEKAGFRRVGTSAKHSPVLNSDVTLIHYRLDKEAWQHALGN